MINFGKNLKIERQNCGLSQKKLAELIGTTQQRISEWENDKVEPTLSNIVAIIKVLHINFEDLIDNE